MSVFRRRRIGLLQDQCNGLIDISSIASLVKPPICTGGIVPPPPSITVKMIFEDGKTMIYEDGPIMIYENFQSPFDWFNTDWIKRIPFTVNTNQVFPTVAGQTNFETLVSFQSDSIKGRPLSEFRFAIGEINNPPELPYEIEFYDDITGTLVAWVLLDDIKDETLIYAYFDNVNPVPPFNNSSGPSVWKLSNNVVAVYHMNQTSFGADSTQDSTGLHAGTPQGNLISVPGGKIDGSLKFDDAPASFITIPDDSALDPGTGPWTVTNWVFRRTSGSQILIAKEVGSVGWSVMMRNNDQWFLRFEDASSNIIRRNSDFAIIANLDTHLVGTYDGNQDANGIKLYKNGVIDPSSMDGNTPISNISVAALCTIAGGQTGFSRIENGDLSETRIYNIDLSADKIKTIHNNENNPTGPLGFFTQGAVELLTPPANWFDLTFKRRVLITINAGQITGTIINFPFLFNSILSDLIPANIQTNGEDVRFASEDGLTEFKVEIEKLDTGATSLQAWAKINSISDGTKFYMYYGKPSATLPPLADRQAVWSDYRAIYHMNQTSFGANSTLDSTVNVHNGTPQNSPVSSVGQIDGDVAFNGTNQFVEIPDAVNLDPGSGAWSVSCWLDSHGTSQHAFVGKQRSNGALDGWVFRHGDGFTLRLFVEFTGATNGFKVQSTVDVSADTLTLVSFTYPGGNLNAANVKIYINGVSVATLVTLNTLTSAISNDVNMNLAAGGSLPAAAAIDFLDGDVDEIHISADVKTPDLLEAEFNNQNDPDSPSGFYILGNVETIG